MEEKNVFKTGKFWLWLVGLLILGAIVLVAILRDRIVNFPQWTVSIIGQGKITVNPDLAKVTLGVETAQTDKAADAYNNAGQVMAKIIAAVKSVGVADKDIQTADYSLTPNYQYVNGDNVLNGYQAVQTVLVTVRDLSKFSQVIAQATAAGANRISNVMFTVENIEQVKNQARLAAIADAKQKSFAYAKAVGVHLGEITGWWENIIQVPYQAYNYPYASGKGGAGGMDTGGAAVGSSSPVPYGPMDVVVEMNLSYRLR